MNRRNFISTLTGAAGAGLILWRVPKPALFLPSWIQEKRLITSANVRFTLTIPGIYPDPVEVEAFEGLLQGVLLEEISKAARIPIRYIEGTHEAHEFFGLEDA